MKWSLQTSNDEAWEKNKHIKNVHNLSKTGRKDKKHMGKNNLITI